MSTLEQAIALAVEKHQGQTDRYGQPYILHPMRVMMRVSGEMLQTIAILHDVVEDSEVTVADLREMGYSAEVTEAVDSVSRREEETYEEFVQRTKQNPLGRQVKTADLEDNMDVRRMSLPLSEDDCARLARYKRAWLELNPQPQP